MMQWRSLQFSEHFLTHCVWGFVVERIGFAPTDKEKMERRERSQYLPSPALEDFTYVHSFTYHTSPLDHVEIYEGRRRISGEANLAWIFKADLWLKWQWKSDVSYPNAPAVHTASPKWLVYCDFYVSSWLWCHISWGLRWPSCFCELLRDRHPRPGELKCMPEAKWMKDILFLF